MSEHESPDHDSQPVESAMFSVYHVSDGLAGQTLAAALRQLLPPQEASWNRVRKWVLNRHVEINGNLCMDHTRRVRSTDVIKLWKTALRKPIGVEDIRIAYMDTHVIVVEKPAGVTSVRHVQERNLPGRRRQLQPTLDELLPPVLAKVQKRPWPPRSTSGSGKNVSQRQPPNSSKGIPIRNPQRLPPDLTVFAVHRLDRDTSGLMVFARTRPAEQALIRQFRSHEVIREYVAVCHGVVQPQTIRSLLVRDRGDGLRGSLPDSAAEQQKQAAQRAVTHVLKSRTVCGGKYSMVRCRLETGRTHQIRIHLSELGNRLCGETVYVLDVHGKRLTDQSGAPRQALHSDRLAFEHPITKEVLKFNMPWPADIADWIRSLM